MDKKLPELSLEEKKKLIEEQINAVKTGNKYASATNFRLELEKTLTDDEKTFIRSSDVKDFYLKKIQETYEAIHNEQIDEEKTNFKNNINSKIALVYSSLCSSKIEFDEKVRKSLSFNERKFLTKDSGLYDETIFNFYTTQLNEYWNDIQTKKTEDLKLIELKKELKNKIRKAYESLENKCNGKDELNNKVNGSLEENEKKLINNQLYDYYIGTLNQFWNDIQEEHNQIEINRAKKMNDFKENINNIITNIYLNNKNSIKKRSDFDNFINGSLDEDQKSYIDSNKENNIKIFFDTQANEFWDKVKEERKNEFKHEIKNIIYKVYSNNSDISSKDELKKKILADLDDFQKELLIDIQDDFDRKLGIFCDDIQNKKSQKRTNFINNIYNRILKVYSMNEEVEKEQLKNLIIQSIIDEDEKKFINEKEINDLFVKNFDLFWVSVEKKRNKIQEEKNLVFYQKKKEFINKINDKILNAFSINEEVEKDQLKDLIIQSIIDEEEKQFINEKEINDLFLKNLDIFWNNVEKKRKQKQEETNLINEKKKTEFINRINDKILNAYSTCEDIESKTKLDELIKPLFDKEEKEFMKDKDVADIYELDLNFFWKNVEKKRKQKQEEENELIEKKKAEFINKINDKILNAYSTCEDVESKTKLDELIKPLFDKEEKEFLKDKDVADIYELDLDIFWKSVEKKRKQKQEEEMANLKNKKKQFKLNIDNLILKIYTIYNEVKTKDELDSKIKEILEEEEKGFLEEIAEYYGQRLEIFWEQKIKDRIFDRINDAYEISKYSEKKEDFEASMEQNLQLTSEESKILKNTKIFDEYKKKLNILWNNSEKERGFTILINQQNERLKELENANKEKEDLFKKEQDKLQNLIEQQKIEVQQLKSDSDKKQKQFDEEREKILNDTKNQIKEAEERMKNEKNEEARKREEEKIKQQQKIEKINNDFYDEVEKLKSEKIKVIKEEIEKIESEFCMKEIEKIDKEIITELIDNLFEKDQIINFVLENLKIHIDKNKDKIKNAKHLNIILVGPSGVGKSTLINAVLENENETKTGFGQIQTKGIEYHESPNIDFLRLADSQGIEKNEKYGISETCKNIQNFIDEQLKEDPDKYIHCIWYCWKGTRLENSEVNVLKTLSKQYTLDSLPVIIVYTNAIIKKEREWAEKYVKDPKEGLNLDNIFIPVLSKEIEVGDVKIPPFGIDILIETSIELAKKAVKSSCYEGLKKEIKIDINTGIS